MQIETTSDFKQPRARVLARLRDPARVESVLRDQGAQVDRLAEPPQPRWQCALIWRSAPRQFTASLTEVVADETLRLDFASTLADAAVTMNLYDLGEAGCRVVTCAELRAHSMVGKLALRTLGLARGHAEDRLGRLIRALGRP